jgi:hypothetical protein
VPDSSRSEPHGLNFTHHLGSRKSNNKDYQSSAVNDVGDPQYYRQQAQV